MIDVINSGSGGISKRCVDLRSEYVHRQSTIVLNNLFAHSMHKHMDMDIDNVTWASYIRLDTEDTVNWPEQRYQHSAIVIYIHPLSVYHMKLTHCGIP
jgi:hypothetical protein